MKSEDVARMLEDRLARLGRIRPSRWNREAWRAADNQLVHRLLRLDLPREQVASLVRRYSAEVAVRTASWHTGGSSARRQFGTAVGRAGGSRDPSRPPTRARSSPHPPRRDGVAVARLAGVVPIP